MAIQRRLRGRQAAQGDRPPARPRAAPADARQRRGAALRRRDLGPQGEGRARRVRAGDEASAGSRSSTPRTCSPRSLDDPGRRGTGCSTRCCDERQVGQYLRDQRPRMGRRGERRREVADFLIGGMTKEEIDDGAGLLYELRRARWTWCCRRCRTSCSSATRRRGSTAA